MPSAKLVSAVPAKRPVVAVDKLDVKVLKNLPKPFSTSEVAPLNKLRPICTANTVPSKSL